MSNDKENSLRIIAHIDLDCFYCQVEHLRLRIPQEEPLAVQQWQRLVAVNYPARAKGIKRGDTSETARRLCPRIHLIHVEVIESKNEEYKMESKQKISLERYRIASSEILSVISGNCSKLERASIDEAFFELTDEVNYILDLCRTFESNSNLGTLDILQDLTTTNLIECDAESKLGQLLSDDINKETYLFRDFFKEEHFLDDICKTYDGSTLKPDNQLNTEEISMIIGSLCVFRIRKQIFNKLGYTTSAGISFNKILSKLASSIHKPNKQVIVLQRNIQDIMNTIELRKLRGFGGKLGKLVQSLLPSITTPGDLQKIDLNHLINLFGNSTGIFISKICRGIDHEPIVPNIRPKSMLASKQFSPQTDISLLEKWLFIMSEEIHDRIIKDFKKFSRRPKTISLHHRKKEYGTQISKSRSCPFPKDFSEWGIPSEYEINSIALSLLKKIPLEELIPCVYLSLGVYEFEDIQQDLNLITKYFEPKLNNQLDSNFSRVNLKNTLKRETDKLELSDKSDSKKEKCSNLDNSPNDADSFFEDLHSNQASDCVGNYTDLKSTLYDISTDSNLEDITWVECGQCGQLVTTKDLQVHLDHHLAIHLSETKEFSELKDSTFNTLGYNESSNLPTSSNCFNKKQKRISKTKTQSKPSENTLFKYFSEASKKK